ncbi:MAG: bifunctional biotin--[acetyl-CoA-carboxylase] ligase/biotin operon repressor BirA [Methylococcaceae bacterium]|nr:MAG: bifunctional biotin--[acetyl-CoA-carboxylase] ligase/biotin operon repressor BirA [Methylococcaceae bacterium]
MRLLRCLAEARFCSGPALAQRLGLTRAAVWKQIQSLKQLGLTVHSVAGKGYSLSAPLELLDDARIRDGLSEAVRSRIAGLQIHGVLDSTNDYLSRQASQDGALVCLAEMQTAGRGRQGRSWVSPFGASIYLSILWRFAEGPASLGGLSLAVGVAAVRALQRVGVEGVGLKWPNDLLWRGRKLGGVLIEVSGESHGPCRAVLGLGLNGALPAPAAAAIDQSWVDLQEICQGTPPSRNQLAAALIEACVALLADYAGHGLKAYLPAWRRLNCLQDQPVTVHFAQHQETGIARDVTDDGLLVLELPDGRRKAYAAGEVRLRSA